MNKFDDGVHHCSNCNEYPCTTQPFVTEKTVCIECMFKQNCCYKPFLVLLPCETNSRKIKHRGNIIMFKKNGWCYYFDEDTRECMIEEIKPISCRVASCRLIREMERKR